MKALILGLALGSVMVVSGACEEDSPFSPEDVTAVEITGSPPILEAGSSVQLAFEVRDVESNLIDLDQLRIRFATNNPSVAVVSATGLVKSVGPGTATMTVEIGSVFDATTITVVPEISSLEIVEAEQNLITGETFRFVVRALDMAGDPVPRPVLTFASSNPGVASVGPQGHVTGEFAGNATITVEGGGERDSFEVTVFAAGSQGTLLQFAFGNSFTVQAGDEHVINNAAPPGALSFVITDSGAELEFTSTDASVVSVDGAGLLTAHAPGEALVTVTRADHREDSATMRIKVLEAGSVDVFEMEPATASIQLQFDIESQFPARLILNVQSKGERITDFLPRLSSSDDTVAVVFHYRLDLTPTAALVDGLAPGTVTITAETGDLTAHSVVTVLPAQ